MSIIEVAKCAGVSKATVSRVINKVGNVSPDTVRLVHQAMEQLNYHPPQSRRGQTAVGRPNSRLSPKGLSMLALILPEVKIGLYSPLQHGFTETIDTSQFQVTVRCSDNDVYQQFDAVGQAIYTEAEGVALVPVSSEETPSYQIHLAQKAGIPVVLLHRTVRGAKAPAFILPFEKVGRYAATMALEHHHRKIAMFTTVSDASMKTFLRGVKERLAETGYDLPDSMFFEHHGRTITISSSQETMLDQNLDHLLKMPKEDRPTAIIATNNRLAETIWIKLFERGCSVPDDMSIITFGSKGNEGGIRDRFAAVTFDAESVGRQAAKVLAEMVSHERDIDDSEQIEIELTMDDGKTLDKPG